MPQAKFHAIRALELDPTLAEAHVSLGVVLMLYEWNWAEAEKQFRLALRLNSRSLSAQTEYAWFLMNMGRWPEATNQLAKALALASGDAGVEAHLTWYLLHQGKYDQAADLCLKVLKANPRNFGARIRLARVYEFQEWFQKSLEEIEKVRAQDDSTDLMALAGYLHARLGSNTEARELLTSLEDQRNQYVSAYYKALICAGLEERERAIKHLTQAYKDRSGLLVGWMNELGLQADPHWNGLRSDEGFIELVKKLSLSGNTRAP